MILALVPLTMYVVTYELAHGRPYSKFEELLLHAVNAHPDKGGCTFADVRSVFEVHDRLLTEGLVTLIQEGWVAMEQAGYEIRYLVTEEGKRTVASGRRPSNLRVRTKHARIVRERLSGQLARASDLGIVTATNLRARGGSNRKVWKEALKPRMMRSEINAGEAERLLPRADEQQEWIRWIASVTRVSQDLHYLPIQVDSEKGTVLGLPYQWQHLVPIIIEEIKERTEEPLDAEFQKEIRALMRAGTDGNLRSGHEESMAFATADGAACPDVALTVRESRDMVQHALAKSAGRALVVAGQLDVDRAAAVRDMVIQLDASGLQTDLLWSCDEAADPKAVYGSLSAARARAKTPRSLTLNTVSSGISADLLLVTTPEGPAAILGSVFTDHAADDRALNVAVRLSDPPILTALARLCAGWWETTAEEHGLLPARRWNHLAERWVVEEARPAGPTPKGEATTCPHHRQGTCSGTISLITGPRQDTVRRGIATEASPRYLLSDGRLALDAARVEFPALRLSAAGGIYQAFGGADGWCFLRRQKSGTWTENRVAAYPPPSPAQRVAASASRWLISSSGNECASALSVQLSGHIAVTAWERTAATVAARAQL